MKELYKFLRVQSKNLLFLSSSLFPFYMLIVWLSNKNMYITSLKNHQKIKFIQYSVILVFKFKRKESLMMLMTNNLNNLSNLNNLNNFNSNLNNFFNVRSLHVWKEIPITCNEYNNNENYPFFNNVTSVIHLQV